MMRMVPLRRRMLKRTESWQMGLQLHSSQHVKDLVPCFFASVAPAAVFLLVEGLGAIKLFRYKCTILLPGHANNAIWARLEDM